MAEDAQIAELSFEEALKELERIVGRLESGDAALEEAIGLYERWAAKRLGLREAQANGDAGP